LVRRISKWLLIIEKQNLKLEAELRMAKKNKRVLNEEFPCGQIYAYACDERIRIMDLGFSENEYIDLDIREAKSLLEFLPKIIAECEENKRSNGAEEGEDD
jgi:hypothetical protein